MFQLRVGHEDSFSALRLSFHLTTLIDGARMSQARELRTALALQSMRRWKPSHPSLETRTLLVRMVMLVLVVKSQTDGALDQLLGRILLNETNARHRRLLAESAPSCKTRVRARLISCGTTIRNEPFDSLAKAGQTPTRKSKKYCVHS